MTESDWCQAEEPHALLAFLQSEGKSSERKLRLFAVACSRRVWAWIDPLGQTAVQTAEAFAFGLASAVELRAARLACQGAGQQAAWYAAASNPAVAARNAARSAQACAANNSLAGTDREELAAQADLVREIFDNPFQSVYIDPAWLTAEVVQLAQTIHDEQTFDRMLALADLLQFTGCGDAEIIAHCRQAAPHVPGCWVLDSLLSRN